MPETDQADLFALSDFATPWSIHVLATLRVADQIAAGIDTIEELATVCGADEDMLRRILEHVVAKGVFLQPEPGRFALNEPAQMLQDGPMRLGLDLDGIGGRFALAWSGLLQQVRTGKPAYADIFGLPFWEDLNAHPDLGAGFDALMGIAGHGAPDPEVLADGDWSHVRTVVDVGGGTGALLAAILQARPHLHGILVDFPRTVADSNETFEAAAVIDRVTTAGQSFFDPLPAGHDLYLLNRVLHDWPDAEALELLRNCAEAVSPSGRVVVVGSVSPESSAGGLAPDTVLVGGKNRGLPEFTDLARQAGLVVSATGQQPTGRFIVECRSERSAHAQD